MPCGMASTEDTAPRRFAAGRSPWTVILKGVLNRSAGPRPLGGGAKRALDLAVAIPLAIVLTPLMIGLAVWVRRDSPGGALFRQGRVGYAGRPFALLKFRSMVVGAERLGAGLAVTAGDSRITRSGAILRRLSLDELPQLWNVIRGEMSLVGPRPALPHEVAQFDDGLLARHRVPPGITGLWQVEGRDNPAFDVYRRLDLFYVENWSLGLDLAIIFATLQAVFGRILHQVRLRLSRSHAGAVDLDEVA